MENKTKTNRIPPLQGEKKKTKHTSLTVPAGK